MIQWVVRLTHKLSVVGSKAIKDVIFFVQERLPSLLSTGRFKEQIRA